MHSGCQFGTVISAGCQFEKCILVVSLREQCLKFVSLDRNICWLSVILMSEVCQFRQKYLLVVSLSNVFWMSV